MNVSMPPELEAFVQAKVESGVYPSAGELIRDALHLLVERDQQMQQRREAMDRFIQVALDEAARGEFCDPDELWADLDRIIAEAEHKHA